eukprot:767083-Hanusia_phi.AAC.5
MPAAPAVGSARTGGGGGLGDILPRRTDVRVLKMYLLPCQAHLQRANGGEPSREDETVRRGRCVVGEGESELNLVAQGCPPGGGATAVTSCSAVRWLGRASLGDVKTVGSCLL